LNEDKTNEEQKRPNAKYKLSNPNQEGLTFYYNRERRLENAPESVKNLYKNEKPARIGLFGSLVADRPRRILFFVIIFLCVGILVFSLLGYFDKNYILDGNKIDITAAGYEGTAVIILRKTAENQKAYTGAVDIAVSPVVNSLADGENYQVFYHRVFFTLENNEVFRFTVPFDSAELLMVIQNEKNTLEIKFKP